MTSTTTVSAPGKVLLAGGYLVLEYPNIGLVLATDKRFYCTVSSSNDNEKKEEGASTTTTIVVDSPQFHSKWTYTFQIIKRDDTSPLLELTASSDNQSENGFVEKSLRVAMAFLWQQQQQKSPSGDSSAFPSTMNITIRADNDFYSVIPHLEERQWKATPENVNKLPKCLPCPKDKETGKPIVNKTGLGSSAALVTSLVSAILQSFGVVDLPSAAKNGSTSSSSSSSIQTAHNLAQICHCHAQGKVGSGFDVSSAVYGSHTYQRFPKDTLTDLLTNLDQTTTSIAKDTAESLYTICCLGEGWKGGVNAKIQMPQGLQLLLADVCGGSESPSMARKVLSWKQQNQQPSYWEKLSSVNENITSLFQQLSAMNITSEYVSILSKATAEQWESSSSEEEYSKIVSLLLQLRKALLEARTNLKAMGDAAGVPIEPDEQTKLADATMTLPGVVAATVPGAGGYDALACLYVDDEENNHSVRDAIGELWSNWSTTHDKTTTVSSLSVRCATGDVQGLCVEV